MLRSKRLSTSRNQLLGHIPDNLDVVVSNGAAGALTIFLFDHNGAESVHPFSSEEAAIAFFARQAS